MIYGLPTDWPHPAVDIMDSACMMLGEILCRNSKSAVTTYRAYRSVLKTTREGGQRTRDTSCLTGISGKSAYYGKGPYRRD
jgi:hypothetical protein